MRSHRRPPSVNCALVACGLVCALAAGLARAEGIMLPAVPHWLAASAQGVSALLGDGSLVHVRGREVRVVTGGFSADAPIRICGGRTVGISRDGRLASVDNDGRIRVSALGGLSSQGGIACRGEHAWAIGKDGAILRFTLRHAQWTVDARAAADALPDGQLTLLAVGRRDLLAVLARPDGQRYRHAILGDSSEATSALLLDARSLAAAARFDLPAPAVFEDLSLRPLTIAGRVLLAVVRSDPQSGAALVLLGLERDDLAVVAEGPAFGQANRWLNPLTGPASLFAIHTPHIGGHLYRYALSGDRLRAQRLVHGVSSHRIGSRTLDNALVLTESASETVLAAPDQSHRSLLVLACAAKCRELSRLEMGAPLASNVVRDDDALWAASSDGRLHRLALAAR